MGSMMIAGRPVGGIGLNLMDLTRPWAPTPYHEAFRALKASLDAGSNLWIGSCAYGRPDNNALHLLAAYFSTYPEDASKVVLYVKGDFESRRISALQRYTMAGLHRSITDSLAILKGTKSIDVFECPFIPTSPAAPTIPNIEESIRVLAEYVASGQIGSIALRDADTETICRAHAVHPLAAVEVELSLFSPASLTDGVAYTCQGLGIPVLASWPLFHGYVSEKIRRFGGIKQDDLRRFLAKYEPVEFNENLKLVEALERMSRSMRCSMPQVAIAWVRAHGALPTPAAASVGAVKEYCWTAGLDHDELEDIKLGLDRVREALAQLRELPDEVEIAPGVTQVRDKNEE